VLGAPTFSLYNQVLLLPAVLLLVRERRALWERSLVYRVLMVATAALLMWSYLSAALLAALSLVLPQDVVQTAWTLPAWTVLLLPVGVAALVLLASYQRLFAGESGAA
jgi:hypothetical protein